MKNSCGSQVNNETRQSGGRRTMHFSDESQYALSFGTKHILIKAHSMNGETLQPNAPHFRHLKTIEVPAADWVRPLCMNYLFVWKSFARSRGLSVPAMYAVMWRLAVVHFKSIQNHSWKKLNQPAAAEWLCERTLCIGENEIYTELKRTSW